MTATKGVVRGRFSSASNQASCSACCCGVRVKSRPAPCFLPSGRGSNVAVEREKRDQRFFCRKLESIPACRHRPTRRVAAVSSAARIFQLGIDFAVRPPLIIVVPQHGIRRTRKVSRRIHLFELCLPTGGAGACRQFAIPVIPQQKQRLRVNRLPFGIGAQARGHLGLCLKVLVSPIAQHQKLRRGRVGLYRISQA